MRWPLYCLFFFFFNDTATTEIYTLSLHDALPIYVDLEVPIVDLDLDVLRLGEHGDGDGRRVDPAARRSEEHTSELQSPCNLVCRLLLEKKKKTKTPSSVVKHWVRTSPPHTSVA